MAPGLINTKLRLPFRSFRETTKYQLAKESLSIAINALSLVVVFPWFLFRPQTKLKESFIDSQILNYFFETKLKPFILMPDPTSASERSHGAAPTSAGGPSLTTSVYDTRLGPAALSWSRSLLGLSLRFILRLSQQPEAEADTKALSFRIRPWLLWRRRGSRRIQLDPTHSAHVSWDLTRAQFALGPEPVSGFFISVSVNGELALVAGDLVDEAYRASKSQKPICISGLKPSILISRREHVDMGDNYKTRVRVWGREMDISINLVGRERAELGFWVAIDGKHILQVKRLKWKFRGSDRIKLEGGNRGDKLVLSWDLHNWVFPTREAPPGTGELDADALFVFKFEKDLGLEEEKVSLGGLLGGQLGKLGANWGNWSESGSSKGRRKGKKGSLKKTGSGSSSTSSSGSCSSGSTIMDWSSAEEFELRRTEGFSLLVYASKTKR
ncbi:hypothetical protein LUZ61_008357 [Rhynchospora tenuis]|uniref:Uncharacterized protein n=1 Tax=Rhynchospora tenuis TaxID=198213 RepID=A0AAD6EXD9_9POAL|nr:hypothetical protein LUZ61_008357 [Rhynchospora tenuis]